MLVFLVPIARFFVFNNTTLKGMLGVLEPSINKPQDPTLLINNDIANNTSGVNNTMSQLLLLVI